MVNNLKNNTKYTGTIKWLDKVGMGYIKYRDEEILITPCSGKSLERMEEGDNVTFYVKLCDSSLPHLMYEAVDLDFDDSVRITVYPILLDGELCGLTRLNPADMCGRCGIYGHPSRDCHQMYQGWFPDGRGSGRENVSRKCDSWSSLFGCKRFLNGGSRVSESIVCVKSKKHVQKFEESEDCFILEFDPTESIDDHVSKAPVLYTDEDVIILSEKRLQQVACRDYPHPRHLCAVHPFDKTPRDIHCKMCYCYVCDQPAPCKKWSMNHCDATPEIPHWSRLRDLVKEDKLIHDLRQECAGLF